MAIFLIKDYIPSNQTNTLLFKTFMESKQKKLKQKLKTLHPCLFIQQPAELIPTDKIGTLAS